MVHPPQQPRPHLHHQARMPSIHPPRLQVGALRHPTQQRHLLNMVLPLALLNHFAHKIGGLKVTDVVAFIGELPGYWDNYPRVPQ